MVCIICMYFQKIYYIMVSAKVGILENDVSPCVNQKTQKLFQRKLCSSSWMLKIVCSRKHGKAEIQFTFIISKKSSSMYYILTLFPSTATLQVRLAFKQYTIMLGFLQDNIKLINFHYKSISRHEFNLDHVGSFCVYLYLLETVVTSSLSHAFSFSLDI